MQTFLPVADFAESASLLDDARLGKQRVEAYQIIRTLDGITTGWLKPPRSADVARRRSTARQPPEQPAAQGS